MQVMTVIWMFLFLDENNGLTSESINALNDRYINGWSISDGQTTWSVFLLRGFFPKIIAGHSNDKNRDQSEWRPPQNPAKPVEILCDRPKIKVANKAVAMSPRICFTRCESISLLLHQIIHSSTSARSSTGAHHLSCVRLTERRSVTHVPPAGLGDSRLEAQRASKRYRKWGFQYVLRSIKVLLQTLMAREWHQNLQRSCRRKQ